MISIERRLPGPLMPDIDPTIAVAQALHKEGELRASYFRKPGHMSFSFSVGLLFLAIVVAWIGLSESPREATAIMERFALRAEAAQRIAPETRDVVAKFLVLRRYDCGQVKCDEQLQARNRLAREKLTQALFGTSVAVSATELANE
jgi:hypothetical protein